MIFKIDLPKPNSKKDFQAMALAIETHAYTYRERTERITFDASGFRVTCDNDAASIQKLAMRLEKYNVAKPAQKYRGARTPSTREMLKTYKKDPDTYYQLLGLINDKQTNQEQV